MSNLPGLDGVIITSAGCKLPGVLYRAAGAGPHPTALLLHGIPGLEKSADLAYALRDVGWNALIFHYRGCWGGEGDYTLAGILDDVQAALNTITNGHWPVAPNRIAAIGHGLGGWAAVVTAASRDSRIRAVATLGGAANLRTLPLADQLAAEYAPFLRNITPKGLQSQWRALGATYNPVDLVDLLTNCPLLIVHGSADAVVPLAQAMELKGRAPQAELIVMEGADHGFSQHRRSLADAVLGWLTAKL